jgi:CBS domain-containing protein
MKRYIENFAKPVITVAPHDPLELVARNMDEHNVGAVIVVDHEQPVGIVTDRDLALALSVGGATARTHAAGVMTTPVETIVTGESVYQATQIMRDRHVRRLAVVDDEGELIGIVTLDDLLRLLSRELANLVEGIVPEMAVC